MLQIDRFTSIDASQVAERVTACINIDGVYHGDTTVILTLLRILLKRELRTPSYFVLQTLQNI